MVWLRGIANWLAAGLARDHFTSGHRYVTWLRHPLLALLLAAATALLCGLYLHPQALVVLAVLAAIVALGLAWPAVSFLGVSGELSFAVRRASEGETVQATLTVSNRWPWTIFGLAVRGGFPQGHQSHDTQDWTLALAWIGGLSETRFTWDFTPDRRGEFPLGAPQLVTGFPFGLYESRRPLRVASRLLVWPRTFPMDGLFDLTSNERIEGTSLGQRAGSGGDLLGVREFQPGDALRRVHWAHTARLDRLLVCEQQSNTTSLATLVLDLDPRWHAGQGTTGSREWLLRIAASLIEKLLASAVQVELILPARRIWGDSSTGGRRRLLDALARINNDHGDWLAAWNNRRSPSTASALQVVLTTRRGLTRLARPLPIPAAVRIVVLDESAFETGPAAAPDTGLPRIEAVQRLLQVTDAGGVVRQCRAGWRELIHV